MVVGGAVREHWRPAQRAKNDAIFWAARLALGAAERLPRRMLVLFGRAVGLLAHGCLGQSRRLALRNVELVFPELPAPARQALVRQCFATLGEALGETVALLRPSAAPTLSVSKEALNVLREAQIEGRGVLFASAHLGPWESVAGAMVRAGLPLVTLARESYDPRLSTVHARLREHAGVGVIVRPRAGASASRAADLAVATRIVRVLRGGAVLGVPMDLRSSVPSCDSTFLGRPARTPVGPARIALRTGASVVVGTAAPESESGGLAVTAVRIPTHDLTPCSGDAERLTRRIDDELSRRIRALPHAWVWMHPRWT